MGAVPVDPVVTAMVRTGHRNRLFDWTEADLQTPIFFQIVPFFRSPKAYDGDSLTQDLPRRGSLLGKALGWENIMSFFVFLCALAAVWFCCLKRQNDPVHRIGDGMALGRATRDEPWLEIPQDLLRLLVRSRTEPQFAKCRPECGTVPVRSKKRTR